MILITTFRNYAAEFKALLDFEEIYLVSREEQLKDYVKEIELDKTFGVMIVPSFLGNGQNEDNYTEFSTLLFYFLQKIDKKCTQDESLDILEALQIKVEAFKTALINSIDDCQDPLHTLGNSLDLKSIHIDPEYNYLSCHGWSMSYKVES